MVRTDLKHRFLSTKIKYFLAKKKTLSLLARANKLIGRKKKLFRLIRRIKLITKQKNLSLSAKRNKLISRKKKLFRLLRRIKLITKKNNLMLMDDKFANGDYDYKYEYEYQYNYAYLSAYTSFYPYLKYDLDLSDEDAKWVAIWFAELFAEWHVDGIADSYWDAYANIDYGYEPEPEYEYTFTYTDDDEPEYEHTFTYTDDDNFDDKLTPTNICDLVEDHSSDGYAEWFASNNWHADTRLLRLYGHRVGCPLACRW